MSGCPAAAPSASLSRRSGSAADLKFLQQVPRVRIRNFKSKDGTTIMMLRVPRLFPKFVQGALRWFTNFGNGALVVKFETLKELNTERAARRPVIVVTDTANGEQRLVKAEDFASDPLRAELAKQLRMGKSGMVEV